MIGAAEHEPRSCSQRPVAGGRADRDRPFTSLSKGEALAAIAWALPAIRIPSGRLVRRADWQRQRDVELAACRLLLGPAGAAVRSSCAGEDRPGRSMAGHFLTLLDVPADGLGAAIDAVFARYDGVDAADQVLVQVSLAPVEAAGVASRRAPPDGAPYVSVSLAAGSCTRAVTEGSVPADTWYVAADAPASGMPIAVREARDLVDELSGFFEPDTDFEIELAWSGGRPWLLQARQVVFPPRRPSRLAGAAPRASAEAELAAHAAAGATLLGLMPDWNPAELIGEHPRPLALSLFEHLISEGPWWRARRALGYAAPWRPRLLRPTGGRPYVDVRASLSSFLPAGLDPASGARLVEHWSDRLQANPELHDRVEFDVAVTCAEFDIDRRLAEAGLDAAERRAAARAWVAPTLGCLDLRELAAWTRGFAEALARPDTESMLTRELPRLRDGLATGFAAAARCDFVASALLRSAVRCGALAESRLDRLMSGVRTAAGARFASDDATLDLADRRAGTFDITAARYRLPSGDRAAADAAAAAASDFAFTPTERRALSALLADAGLAMGPEPLLQAALAAAQARELGKYVLAARVSGILDHIAAEAERIGIDREAASWLPWTRWQGATDRAELLELVQQARALHDTQAELRMPALLVASRGLSVVRCPPSQPSFLGSGEVAGRVLAVDRHTDPADVPEAALIAIEGADPGFDWIFTRAPRALLTAWGGPHSHMALRCRELGCPVVLGLGRERFQRLLAAGRLLIDFRSRAVHALRH